MTGTKIEKAIDMLETYAVDDDIPINEAGEVSIVVKDAREELDAIRGGGA